jgi:exodeoxyribonuclease V gamma subunit
VAGRSAEEFAHSHSKRPLALDDRSLTLHVCHSPQREVEVLHDRLLAMLEENPELTPRDIIVMVADIDSYSPYIQAVFGSASGERWLPWAISDRRATESHPALQAFITLLSLPDSRFASEDVLALLDVPVLAARFNIDEEGCAICVSGLMNPACAGEWMTIMCANWICPPPGNTPGALA